MSDKEDWRRRKAEELGLIDTGPRPSRPLSAPAPTARVVPPYVHPAGHDPAPTRQQAAIPRNGGSLDRGGGVSAAASAAPGRSEPGAQAARLLAFLAGLALAVLLGWWLRGAASSGNAEQSVLNTAQGAATTAGPETAMSGLPAAVDAEPDPVRQSIPEPAQARIAPVPAAASPAPRGRLTAPRAFAAAGRNFSPSFNCRRATSWVNRTICNNRKLATLDVRMSNAYGNAIAAAGPAQQRRIDAAQVRFLNKRGRCPTEACLDRVYRSRIRELARQS